MLILFRAALRRIERIEPRGVCFKPYRIHDEKFLEENLPDVGANLDERISIIGV